MYQEFDRDSAILHHTLNATIPKFERQMTLDRLRQKFSVNLVRREFGAGTPEDPVQYGAPVVMFGGFTSAKIQRVDYGLCLGFNGRNETGSNPRQLAVSGHPSQSWMQLCVQWQAVMKFLIDSNLLHMVDFAEIQEKVSRYEGHGPSAVARFDEINARSIEIVSAIVQ